MKHHITSADRIIIDRGALDRGDPAVQVISETQYGTVRRNFRAVQFRDGMRVTQHSAPQQDGTRVSIENPGPMEVFK